MSEMKHASSEAKMIAATIIINHGVAVTPGVVSETVWLAVDPFTNADQVTALIDEVTERIKIAEVDVHWPDDEDDRVTSDISDAAACDGSCCTNLCQFPLCSCSGICATE